MLKVLFVDQFAELGGGQRILHDIVHYFSCEGVQCIVALPGDGPFAQTLRNENVQVRDFPLAQVSAGRKTLRDAFALLRTTHVTQRALRAILEETSPQVVFCNGPRCVPALVTAAGKLNIPVICAVHLIFSRGLKRLLMPYFKKPIVRTVTFCSRQALAPFEDLAAEKKLLIGNWVSPHFQTAPKTARAKELFGFGPSDVVVGVVGRISPHKGQFFFLESLLPMLEQLPHLHLAIAGSSDHEDAQEEARIRRLVEEHPSRHRVHLLGKVANATALMDALDVLVVPSLWEEPFGLVAVEGMSRGLTVIATRSGALVDTVRDGETGLLIDPKPERLREAVASLVGDELKRREMGDRGKAIALGEYAAEPRLRELFGLVSRIAG